MSGIRHQKAERGKPHYAEALRALYPTSDLQPLLFAERGPESFRGLCRAVALCEGDRKSTRLNSSHVRISYAVFCLKKKKKPASSPSRRKITSQRTGATTT